MNGEKSKAYRNLVAKVQDKYPRFDKNSDAELLKRKYWNNFLENHKNIFVQI